MSADWMANDDEDAQWAPITAAIIETGTPPRDQERSSRGGRPKGSTTSDRQQVALRIPRNVLDHFRAGGPGWQTRMIAVLQREVQKA